MITGRNLRPLTCAAALVAVALLAFATVRSTVMQAQAATPWGMAPICMTGGGVGGRDADPRRAALAACSVCMAAAHAPLQTFASPLAMPVCLQWRAASPVAPPVPRQPPAPQPRARGPPIPVIAL